MNLATGSIVGDYQIIGVLGEGGMGKVFKVRNTISDRIEAMKILLPNLEGEPDLADRFLREIKVLASLNHPNIAGLRTAVRFENQLLMIMELVDGESLDHRLQHHGRLPVEEAVRYVSQALAALACAHERGVIHRDIKPANMMVTPDGTVKLMDFGIAKSATDRKLTMTGTTMGSLYYMSPEQITGVESLDARSDLYSVGVSLYELVTGKRPFDGDSQFAIMSAHLQQTPAPPVTIDPSLPQELNDLILLSVNREPSGRFQSADAFRNALNSVLHMQQTALPTIALNPAEQRDAALSPAPAKSHRAVWATVGALVCVAALVAAITLLPSKKTSAGNPPVVDNPPVTSQTPVTPPPVVSQPPVTQPAVTQPAVTQPVQTNQPVASTPQVSEPVRKTPPRTSSQVQQAPTGPAQLPPATNPVQHQPAVQQPAVVSPPPQQQPDLSAKRAELQKVREALVMVSARATSLHSTLENLKRKQEQSGLGLRSDWVQAQSLMDSFLQGANDALAAGDAATARDLMEKGERQVEKLEKGLGR
jgi:eukaryotic-like serine/threonine-protein kinase